MKKYKLTIVGITLAFVVFFITIIFKVDLFENVIKVFESLERFEIDEIVIPVCILLIFAFIDQTRRQGSHKIEIEKVMIYKAMMSSTHHILNNFLNQMQLFKMTAENTPDFDTEILSLFDMVIKDTSEQIEALGSITNIDEASIHASVAPKLNSQLGAQKL